MPDPMARPTRQRYLVVMAATLMAVLLYLDRICISIAEVYISQALGLSEVQTGTMLAAFFYSYALGQVPAGWLTDRFGARKMLTLYILVWSLFTALTGLAGGFMSLFLFRLGMGFGQAGAYPTAASMVSKWVPFSLRGTASSVVAMGGRVGGSMDPFLTAILIVLFVPVAVNSLFQTNDLLKLPVTAYQVSLADLTDASSLEDENARLQANVGQLVLGRMEPSAAEQVRALGQAYQQAAKDAKDQAEANGEDPKKATADVSSLQPQIEASHVPIRTALNELLRSPGLVANPVFDSARSRLPRQALTLLEQEEQGQELPPEQLARLNRLALEVVYPDLRRIYGEGWRDVMYVYGAAGLLVAGLFWWIVRDEPTEHPRVNAAEVALIQHGRPASSASSRGRATGLPFKALLTSANMWLTSISQFTTNYGWVFLVTFLPRYLQEVHHVPIEMRGFMTLLPITVGWVGMLGGGPLTDWMTRRFGMRWGRALPMGLTRFMAMAGYIVCLVDMLMMSQGSPSSPWISVAALSVVAFSTDLGVPAVWAFQQDIAGRYVGSALGWGNMWGNLGAGVASNTLTSFGSWTVMFGVAAGAFFVSGVTALLIDARVPLVPEEESPS